MSDRVGETTKKNTAAQNGGALDINGGNFDADSENAKVEIENCTFEKNKAGIIHTEIVRRLRTNKKEQNFVRARNFLHQIFVSHFRCPPP